MNLTGRFSNGKIGLGPPTADDLRLMRQRQRTPKRSVSEVAKMLGIGTPTREDLKMISRILQAQGRGGDTILAHINPQEARMLKRRGGSGTINPMTGLPEFFTSLYGGGSNNEDDNDNDTSSDGSEFESNTLDTSTNSFDFDSSSNGFGDTSNLNLDDFVDINDTTTTTLGEGNDDFNNLNTLLDGDTPTNIPSGDSPNPDLKNDLPEDDEPEESLMTDDQFKDKVYTEALNLPETYNKYGKDLYASDPTDVTTAKGNIRNMQNYGMKDGKFSDITDATGTVNTAYGTSTTGALGDFASGRSALDKGVTSAKNLTTKGPSTTIDEQTVTASDIPNMSMDPYMNPYKTQVLDNAISRLDDARKRALMGEGARAGSAYAFGGDRQGVQEALINQDYMRQVGDLSSSVLDRGFDRATDLMTSDANRKLTADRSNQDADLRGEIASGNLGLGYGNLNLGATNTLGNMGSRYGDLGATGLSSAINAGTFGMGATDTDINRRYRNIGSLMNVGMDTRNRTDLGNKFDFSEFRAGEDYPYKRLSALGSIMTGAPIKQPQPTYSGGGGKGGLF